MRSLGIFGLQGYAISGNSFSLHRINKVMKDASELVMRLLNAEASHNWAVDGCAVQTEDNDELTGLTRKYPWWTHKAPVEEKNKPVLGAIDNKTTPPRECIRSTRCLMC